MTPKERAKVEDLDLKLAMGVEQTTLAVSRILQSAVRNEWEKVLADLAFAKEVASLSKRNFKSRMRIAVGLRKTSTSEEWKR